MLDEKKDKGYSNWKFVFRKESFFYFVLVPFTILMINAVIQKIIFGILNLCRVKFKDHISSDFKSSTSIYYFLLFIIILAVISTMYPNFKNKD